MKFLFDKTSSSRNQRLILFAKIGAAAGVAGLGYLLLSGPVRQFLSSNIGSPGPVVTRELEVSSSNGFSSFLELPYEFWLAGVIGVLVWLLWQTTHGRGPLGKMNNKLRDGGSDWQGDDYYSQADSARGRGKTPGFLQRQRGKLLAQGMIGLSIFFAFFLSVGSFLTTTEGMINFTTPEGNAAGTLPFSVPISLTVSLGIQGVLFIISWVVAQDLAERSRKRAEVNGHAPHLLVRMFLGLVGLVGLRPQSNRRNSTEAVTSQVNEVPYIISDFGKVAMLLISMFASVFFSFDSLFDRVFKLAEREKVELSIARSETASSFSLIRNGLVESRSVKLKQLADSDGWSKYHSNVNAVLDLALNSQKILTESIRQQQAELEADADKIKKDLNNKLAELEKYKTQISALNKGETTTTGPDPEQLKLQLAPIRQRVDSLKVEIARLDVELNIEAVEGRIGPDGIRRRPGKGPAYRVLKKERGVAQSELAPLQNQQKKLGDQLKRAFNSVAGRESQLERLEQSIEPLNREIATLMARQKAALLSQQSQVSDESAGRINQNKNSAADMVSTIRRARDEFFTTGSEESFNAMANGCVQLQSVLERNKDKFDNFSALSCDAGLISEHTDGLRELSLNLAQVSAACIVNREYYGLNNVEAYVAKGRSCLNLAKLPYKSEQPIRALFDKVERENSKETSNFTRSVASLRRLDTLAWVALLLAISIDSLVFFSAVAGAFASNRLQIRREGGLPTSEDSIDPTIPSYYPMDAKARIELGAQLRSGFAEDKRVFKYVDLKRIEKGNIRTTVRQLLMRYPNNLVIRIGEDVYELKQKVIDNESEILSEAKRYLEAVYGPIKPQMDGSETGFAGSDMDGVPENHETDFKHLDGAEESDRQEPPEKNPPVGKSSDDDSKKAADSDADNVVNIDPASVRAKSTPHFH